MSVAPGAVKRDVGTYSHRILTAPNEGEQGHAEHHAIKGERRKSVAGEEADEEPDGEGRADEGDHQAYEDVPPAKRVHHGSAAAPGVFEAGRAEQRKADEKAELRGARRTQPDEIAAHHR